jgi:CrcB protein
LCKLDGGTAIVYRAAGEVQALLTYLWIAIGGAIGSVARYGCSDLAARTFGGTFPWGTLIVNVVGSFVIGAFATLTGPDGRWMVGPDARIFVTVGICGGFTTFSSFSLQTLNLMRAGEVGAAGVNIAGSVVLCLLSVWVGYLFGALVNQGRGG